VARRTAFTLFLLFSADPCVAVIPLIFAAAPLGVMRTVAVVAVYELATMGTMVGLVLFSRAGAQRLRFHFLDHYGDSAAGGLIAATGAVFLALGL
jgi:hypothetical protein